ncbi:MAG: VWA domain-containing protein [Parvibaculaceae bacterium]
MLPRAAEALVLFARLLRQHGFAVSHDRTILFLEAVRLLGPRSMQSIRLAALAALAPPVDRRGEFDALFRAYFFEEGVIASVARSLPEDEAPVVNSRSDQGAPPELDDTNPSGKAATRNESLSLRSFETAPDDQAIARLTREADRALPRRRSFRTSPGKTGESLDLRRSLRRIFEHDGDIIHLVRSERNRLQRPLILLIDVSGSMKSHTADYLTYAHALTQAARKVETFTFGTRLTRITRDLEHRDRARALQCTAERVADWDGGTRIGPALQTFLAIPRFSSMLRGAIVLVLSDGLERGDNAPMQEAVARIARRAWYLGWLTPLAADPRFRPETGALKAILAFLDRLDNGGSVASLVDHTLQIGSGR